MIEKHLAICAIILPTLLLSVGYPAYGQTMPQFSLNTNKMTYGPEDLIQVTMKTDTVQPYAAIATQILDPDGHLVGINQGVFGQDGTYSFVMKLHGPLWQKYGTYTIVANYGSNSSNVVMAKSSFDFEPLQQHQTTTEKIPHWVKSIFAWYGQGKISDDDLLNAIKFLVESNIIQLKTG